MTLFLSILCDIIDFIGNNWNVILISIILIILLVLLIGILFWWKKKQQGNNYSIRRDFFNGGMLKDIYSELIGAAIFGLIIWVLQISLQEKIEELKRPICYFEGIVLDNNTKKPIQAIYVTIYDVESKNDKVIGSDITSFDGMFKIPIPNGTKLIKVVFQDVYETRYNSYTIPQKEVINWKIAQKQYLQKK